MRTFAKEMKKMPMVEIPDGLHSKIVKKIFFLEFKTPFIVIVSLLLANLLISGWHFWSRIVEMDTLNVMKDMLGGFELSYSFVSDFINTMIDFAPIKSTLIFLVNSLLVGYVTRIYFRFRKLPAKRI